MIKGIWFAGAMGGAAIGTLLAGSLAYAEPATPTPEDELRALKEFVTRQAEELEAQRQALEIQLRRLENLEKQVNAGARPVLRRAVLRISPPQDDCVDRRCEMLRTAEEKKQERAAEEKKAEEKKQERTAEEKKQEAPAPGAAGAPGRRIKPAETLQIPAIAERATALIKKGTLIVEPSIEYNTTTLNRVVLEGFTVIPAITIGSIDIREVDRDVLVGAATFRYGITDILEVDVRVPYVYRQDSTTTRPIGTGASEDVTTDVTGMGLGDIELAAHYQVLAGNAWPFVILNGRVKTRTGKDPFKVGLDANGLETELPTGTGFWGLEPGVTVLFPSDPVVFFGTVSYLFNLSATKTLQDTGASVDVDPGDAARFSFGMGFSINEQASFSLGYEHSFVFKSKVDGVDVGGSDLQVGSLLVGVSYRVTDNTTVNVSVGIGATEEAPDVSLRLRVPTSWDIF